MPGFALLLGQLGIAEIKADPEFLREIEQRPCRRRSASRARNSGRSRPGRSSTSAERTSSAPARERRQTARRRRAPRAAARRACSTTASRLSARWIGPNWATAARSLRDMARIPAETGLPSAYQPGAAAKTAPCAVRPAVLAVFCKESAGSGEKAAGMLGFPVASRERTANSPVLLRAAARIGSQVSETPRFSFRTTGNYRSTLGTDLSRGFLKRDMFLLGSISRLTAARPTGIKIACPS